MFNNLTYKASPRELWKGNPIAANGIVGGKLTWTATDGRKWSTECDTETTGRGGCRAYAEARVVAATPNGYQWHQQWVLNHMIRFSPSKPTPSTPAPTPTPLPVPDYSFIVDDNLHQCLVDRWKWKVEICADPYQDMSPMCQGVTTLEGLDQIPTITELGLFASRISVLTPLTKLPGLTHLSFDNTILDGITKIYGLLSLQRLYFGGSSAPSLTKVELPTLVRFEAQRTTLGPLSEVAIPRVKSISFTDAKMPDGFPLAGPQFDVDQPDQCQQGPEQPRRPSVDRPHRSGWPKRLDVPVNSLTSLDGIEGLASLRILYAHRNAIEDIGALAGHTQLQEIHLHWNPVADLSPVAGLVNLRQLGVREAPVADIQSLAKLTKLQTLVLIKTAVTDVSPHVGLTNLKGLWVGGSPIENLGVLDPLVAKGLIIDTTTQ